MSQQLEVLKVAVANYNSTRSNIDSQVDFVMRQGFGADSVIGVLSCLEHTVGHPATEINNFIAIRLEVPAVRCIFT